MSEKETKKEIGKIVSSDDTFRMINAVASYLEDKAEEFGATKPKDETQSNPDRSYIKRMNFQKGVIKDNDEFFGIIAKDEALSGPYSDFSFVIAPSDDYSVKNWVVCFIVGSSGFNNDAELATHPGLRRTYMDLVDYKLGYIKSDFSDLNTGPTGAFLESKGLGHFKNSLGKTYSKVLSCFMPFKPRLEESGTIDERSMLVPLAFLAAYANMRNWPSNEPQRKAIDSAIDNHKVTVAESRTEQPSTNDPEYIKKLLLERKYIVLQGAPGTGKTRMAQFVADSIPNSHIVFTQFHAETSYSDFIYGLRPDSKDGQLLYTPYKGVFVAALEFALANPSRRVVLIVDEINRANLANVLGPIFYLFERDRDDKKSIRVAIYTGKVIEKLPDNLYFIGTMNTADRSLGRVDFALRRRFAWILMHPHKIEFAKDSNLKFFQKEFDFFNRTFQWHAKSEELALQPGQGYFIAEDDAAMKNRIRYELLPLIREYLQEGLMLSAKEEFNSYFLKEVSEPIDL